MTMCSHGVPFESQCADCRKEGLEKERAIAQQKSTIEALETRVSKLELALKILSGMVGRKEMERRRG